MACAGLAAHSQQLKQTVAKWKTHRLYKPIRPSVGSDSLVAVGVLALDWSNS
jgi:hypothetical protein